jgi:hypothetical protein
MTNCGFQFIMRSMVTRLTCSVSMLATSIKQIFSWETCDPSAHQEVRNLWNPKIHYCSHRLLVLFTWILSTSQYPVSRKLISVSRKWYRSIRFLDWNVVHGAYFSDLPGVINALPSLFRCLHYFYFINLKVFRKILQFCSWIYGQNSGI